jgi:hypothetical protein
LDLEYWKVMGKGIPPEGSQLQLGENLHQWRRDIMEEIFAHGEDLRPGTKDIVALHAWSDKMWSNRRQPPPSHQGYEIWCRLYDKEPYPERLTATRE